MTANEGTRREKRGRQLSVPTVMKLSEWGMRFLLTAVLAGACALLLQWGVREGNEPAMGTYQIRAYLIRGCLRRADMEYPNNQWGYGAIQLMQTFHLMREL